MSGYEVAFYPDTLKDLKRLDGSQRKHVFKAIERIRTNPLPQNEGGFGKPLGNKAGTDLTGFMKIKLRGSGIRIVYRLIKIKGKMAIVVVGAREDMEAYRTAQRRAIEPPKGVRLISRSGRKMLSNFMGENRNAAMCFRCASFERLW